MIDTSIVTSVILALPPRHQVPTSEDRAEAWGGLIGSAIAFLVLLAIVLLIRSVIRKMRGDY